MAEPNDEWEDAPDDQWVDVPEGGAEGGGGGDTAPSKQLIRPVPVSATDAAAEEAEKQRRWESTLSSLTHGQSRSGLSADQREELTAQGAGKALGQGIAFARGTPLVGAHLDELSALLQTGKLKGPAYDAKLKDARGAVNQSVKDNPSLPLLGSLAFAPGLPATAPGRVALSTASGVSEGVGTAPTMSQAVRPALVGGATGLGTGLLGELAIGGGNYLGGKKADVLAGARAATDKVADRGFASARGSYGGDVSNASNLIQSAERAVGDERLSATVRQRAAEWLDSSEALALREQVALSNLGRGEDALARMGRSKEAMGEAAKKLTPEARAAAADARVNDPTAFLRRTRELAPKVVLPAVGGAILGPLGAGAGGLASAVLGRSATTVKNALTDPYVATRLLGAGETALGAGGRAVSSSAPSTSRELLAPYLELLEKEKEP